MVLDSEGIVLKQTKTVNGKKFITIFTPKYGKLSVATNIAPSNKGKTTLITRPFTYGRYSLFKGKETYSLSAGEVINSFFSIGEDYDKFVVASYALELTDKLTEEEDPNPKLFNILKDFLSSLLIRKVNFDTLLVTYMAKAMDVLGILPNMKNCSCCGKEENINRFFSIKHGGMICDTCAANQYVSKDAALLIYDTKFGIIDAVFFLVKEPFSRFEKLALNSDAERELKRIFIEYIKYHFDISELKTENMDI